jgi:hypothetical protein
MVPSKANTTWEWPQVKGIWYCAAEAGGHWRKTKEQG